MAFILYTNHYEVTSPLLMGAPTYKTNSQGHTDPVIAIISK